MKSIGMIVVAMTLVAMTQANAQDATRLLRDGDAAPPPAQAAPAARPPAAAAAPGAQSTPRSGRATVLAMDELRNVGTLSSTFVLAFGKQSGIHSGSGFFIAPDLIMTNQHVVAQANEGVIIFAADRRRYNAKVEAGTGPVLVGDHDFAVLKLDSPVGKRPVVFTTRYQSLNNVVAFGFPGIVSGEDQQNRAMWLGDQRAMPTLVASTGTVQNVMESRYRIEIITHSAKISGGNSGGALFDACGRVMGINSFIAVANVLTATRDNNIARRTVSEGYHWAISSAEMIKFLKSRGYEPLVDNSPCEN